MVRIPPEWDAKAEERAYNAFAEVIRQANVKVPIIVGVPEKGMLTWKGVLTPSDIHAVASYVFTLRGTHPPNPKIREDQAPVSTEVFE